MNLENAYAELTAILRQVHVLASVNMLISWDEQVNLPPDSGDQRAEQRAVMAEVSHVAAISPRLGELLGVLEQQSTALDPDQAAVVREARVDYDRATRLPKDFVREQAMQRSRGFHVWAQARADDNFAAYIPALEKNLELARRQSQYLGWAGREYDGLIDLHDAGMTAEKVAGLFAELKRELVPLARTIAASPVKPPTGLLQGCPVASQETFLREVTAQLGFNYRRGRIDVALHPFCSGTGADTRLTTRYREDDPLKALFGSIHETGHGLYQQGLSRAFPGTALSDHAGMSVHESQSRLWENQVGRSRGFWRSFEPRFRELFPAQTAGVSTEQLYLAVNAVKPGLIRVEADEVQYNLHIILRFELEQRLLAGTLAVPDLPAAWNAASQELLGITPSTDREGVLQDVHWSGGAFGYFPTYALGNMMAAQLWYRALELRPDLETDFVRGDFSWLLNWLRKEVHAAGRRYAMPELLRRITGQTLSPQPLLRYLRERYLPLYAS